MLLRSTKQVLISKLVPWFCHMQIWSSRWFSEYSQDSGALVMAGIGTPAPASSLVVALDQACFAQLKAMLQCLAILAIAQIAHQIRLDF